MTWEHTHTHTDTHQFADTKFRCLTADTMTKKYSNFIWSKPYTHTQVALIRYYVHSIFMMWTNVVFRMWIIFIHDFMSQSRLAVNICPFRCVTFLFFVFGKSDSDLTRDFHNFFRYLQITHFIHTIFHYLHFTHDDQRSNIFGALVSEFWLACGCPCR